MTPSKKQLTEQNHQLVETVAGLNETITCLTQTIEDQNRRIEELLERLNKNSRNSSKPPSSETDTKSRSRKASGNPPGAMPADRTVMRSIISISNKVRKRSYHICRPAVPVVRYIKDAEAKHVLRRPVRWQMPL